MNKEQLWRGLELLNKELGRRGVIGEVGLYGGAVMCLVLNAREATHDIDAVFNPKYDIAEAARQVARDLGISKNWFNDAVKGFLSDNNDLIPLGSMSNMNLYAASPEYMFAMKAVACRMDNENELDDIKFLIGYLGIGNVEQAESIIYKYYPQNRLLPKTHYMLSEILGG